jgi:hypothetical protein
LGNFYPEAQEGHGWMTLRWILRKAWEIERAGVAYLVQRLGYELDESEFDTRWYRHVSSGAHSVSASGLSGYRELLPLCRGMKVTTHLI